MQLAKLVFLQSLQLEALLSFSQLLSVGEGPTSGSGCTEVPGHAGKGAFGGRTLAVPGAGAPGNGALVMRFRALAYKVDELELKRRESGAQIQAFSTARRLAVKALRGQEGISKRPKDYSFALSFE